MAAGTSGGQGVGGWLCHRHVSEIFSVVWSISAVMMLTKFLKNKVPPKHRFGEIALSWGLCAPEHVWQAWCDQLLSQVQKVDL